MLSRRRILSAAVIAPILGAEKVIACPAISHRYYDPAASDRDRMRRWLARFRANYNRGDLKAATSALDGRSLEIYNEYSEDGEALLRKFREKHGRMLTPVDVESTIFQPEAPRLFFATTLELDNPWTDDDVLDLSCPPPGSHAWVSVQVDFQVDQRSNRVTDNASMSIGASLRFG